MSDTLEEHRAKRVAAAVEAMALGQAAMASGDWSGAVRWLDRARRVSGGNDAVELLLAGARLRLGDAGAADALAAIAARHDVREAWLGLANARFRAGDAAGAAAALQEALAGHAGDLPESAWPMAAPISRGVGAAGWCCLAADGRVLVRPAQDVREFADGRVEAASGWLLGSPLQRARMFRLEAFVAAEDGGLSGYAWHPNAPDCVPALRAVSAGGVERPIALGPPGAAAGEGERHDRPLAQPRAFVVAREDVPGPGLLRVVDGHGADITGSPLDPGAIAGYVRAVVDAAAGRAVDPAALLQAPVPAAFVGLFEAPVPGPVLPPEMPPAIVVPVYRGLAATLDCLASVFAHTPPECPIIVVDDAGPEPALAAALDGLAEEGRIELIRHDRNRGFPSAANTGIRTAGEADVVLLNADTLVSPDWLGRLRAIAWSAADIGTVTPFSNDATLLSYPRRAGGNPVPDRAVVARIASWADRANRGMAIDIPTAVGFCMFIKRACLDQIGLLREDVFAQGYGEENDFCLRARHRGWRHVAAAGVFVGHVGGVSFGAARNRLLARNVATLNRLHPGYDALIAADACGPALARARRGIDLAALSARRRKPGGGSVILITHDLGGGVERRVRVRADAIRAAGEEAIIIRPVLQKPLLLATGRCTVDLGPDTPNLEYDLAQETKPLVRLLASRRPRLVELHHLLGHDHRIADLPRLLGVSYEAHLHDYAWFCQRVTLVDGARRYCGEPDLAGCAACIADWGRNTEEDIGVAELVARSAADLAGAARVVAPCADVASRFARHFPGLAAVIEPWDDAAPPPARAVAPASAARPRHIAVLGAIGIEKGYDILLACARDAASRDLSLRFTVIGHTTDDARLLATGRVFITGEYAAGELQALIDSVQPDLAFLPSIWPETWCFTLSEAWRAGLRVAAFDLGAPAERIRAQGGGMLLPLGCSATRVNDALLR